MRKIEDEILESARAEHKAGKMNNKLLKWYENFCKNYDKRVLNRKSERAFREIENEKNPTYYANIDEMFLELNR